MFRRFRLLGSFAVMALGSAGGCSGPAYEFAPVKGKVTLEGEPLAGVVVKFYPVSESNTQLPIASGTTDESGAYELSAGEDKPGALVGPNIAVVRRPVRDRAAPKVRDVPIPIKYTIVTESPLNFEVRPGPGQTIDLTLKND